MASSSTAASVEAEKGGKADPSAQSHPTWEDQLKLAERLREIGVTCKACLQGPWYHKPHDGGDSCCKHMISAGSVSSPMSIADLRKRGEAMTARGAVLETAGEYTTAKNSRQPLSEYVRFETKEGMALLYHPQALWTSGSARTTSGIASANTT